MDDSQDLNFVAASDNRINFFRLTRIVLDNIPHTLRNVFSNKYTEKHGTSWQVAFGKPLSHQIKCRFKDQQHLVASGDPQKWDSTILCNVLLHPSWQLTKLESDAIKNLQNIRNICFAHRAEATISSQELSDIVQDIEKAYKDMKIPLSEISTMKDIEKETIAQSDLVNKLSDAEERMKKCHSQNETVQMIVDLVLSVTDQLRTSLKEDICELRSDMEEEVDKLKEQISELHVTVGSNCDIPQIIGEKKHIPATTPEYAPSAVTKRHRRKLPRENVSFDSDDETSGFEDMSVNVTENESTRDENDGNEEVKMKGVYEPFYSTSADEPISSSMQDTDSTIVDERISSSVQDTGNKMQFENEPVSCSEGQQQMVGSTQTSDKSQVQMSSYLAAIPVSATESDNTVKAKQDRIDELEGEIEEYKRKLDIISQEIISLQQQLNEKSSSEEVLRKKLLAMEEEQSKLQESKYSVENILDQMKKELARINKQHELQMKTKDLEIKYKDLEMENIKLRANEEKRKEMDELRQKCSKLEAKNEILEAERNRRSETKSDIVSIDNLQILKTEELGHGAFGMVFKGLWEDKSCAVKMLHYSATSMVMLGSTTLPETTQHKECDVAAVRSFSRECEHLKSLQHPNIVKLLTIFQNHGRPVIVMELLDCNLGKYITQYANNNLQKLTQLSISCQLSAGLKYLHQKNIVHRDLCGDNVLIKLQDPILAKISDFGTSKMVDEENQRRSFSMQVPYRAGYLPPEIEESPRLFDPSIDVFMYGVVSLQIVYSIGCVRDREHRRSLFGGIPDHPLKDLVTACIVEKERRPSAQDIAHRAKQVYDFEIAAGQ